LGKVAILSFLFNWPSTGGGIIHTVELARFLRKAGYDARHIFARYTPWGIGSCQQPLETPCEVLDFDDAAWNVGEIQRRYRRAVEEFDPDWVIITDSWNFKPLLAEAVRGYPYFLRQQAQECLCPLNNLRLLVDADGQARQCPLHQLATPQECLHCLSQRGGQSGGLHQLERALAGVGTPQYDACLRTALREAQAVLALNPLVAALLEPYCREVRVVTWGMDAARFPWPWPTEPERLSDKTALFMGGVIQELIKGFHVLRAACQQLWHKRQDFELVATGEPPGRVDEFTRFVGWLSQEELPRYLRAADIVVMPTIAQEGLGRITVEAMGVGRPVIASRIGGLPYTVQDGATGLLCEPGDADDLAAKIEELLDSPAERKRMGDLGRARFEREFTWDVVIQRDYVPLLQKRTSARLQSAGGLP
jgi:glycosyltransferase involved in cell wall biosynthesis